MFKSIINQSNAVGSKPEVSLGSGDIEFVSVASDGNLRPCSQPIPIDSTAAAKNQYRRSGAADCASQPTTRTHPVTLAVLINKVLQ